MLIRSPFLPVVLQTRTCRIKVICFEINLCGSPPYSQSSKFTVSGRFRMTARFDRCRVCLSRSAQTRRATDTHLEMLSVPLGSYPITITSASQSDFFEHRGTRMDAHMFELRSDQFRTIVHPCAGNAPLYKRSRSQLRKYSPTCFSDLELDISSLSRPNSVTPRPGFPHDLMTSP